MFSFPFLLCVHWLKSVCCSNSRASTIFISSSIPRYVLEVWYKLQSHMTHGVTDRCGYLLPSSAAGVAKLCFRSFPSFAMGTLCTQWVILFIQVAFSCSGVRCCSMLTNICLLMGIQHATRISNRASVLLLKHLSSSSCSYKRADHLQLQILSFISLHWCRKHCAFALGLWLLFC